MLAGARAGAVRPVGFLRHGGFRWLWIAAILALVAGAGYRYADVHPRPGGGTWYGYVLGIAGAVLGEMPVAASPVAASPVDDCAHSRLRYAPAGGSPLPSVSARPLAPGPMK